MPRIMDLVHDNVIQIDLGPASAPVSIRPRGRSRRLPEVWPADRMKLRALRCRHLSAHSRLHGALGRAEAVVGDPCEFDRQSRRWWRVRCGGGLECVSLLGTQLAPEDISGVPKAIAAGRELVRGHPLFAPPSDEAGLAGRWRDEGVPEDWTGCGASGSGPCIREVVSRGQGRPVDFPALFAAGLTVAVTAAVDVAGGARESMASASTREPPWMLARFWFIASYPLLAGGQHADRRRRRRTGAQLDIAIASVSPTAGELYVNPHAQLTADEWRFVIAHEALHAALAHHARMGGRRLDLFNIACDFVVNGWLIEMRIGAVPAGSLHDPQLAGHSAEEVYDRIAREARRYRKLATLRGRAGGDVLGDALPRVGDPIVGVDLDGLLRRSLLAGLDCTSPGNAAPCRPPWCRRSAPADGPILIITDGWCDTLRVRREHAYLILAGAYLPFTAKGPVFRID